MEQDHVKQCRREREREMLSRDEVRKKFAEWGVENPTEEQVSDYLAQIGKEVKSSEDKAQRYKDDALRVKELQKQLDEMNNAKLTDEEKSAKAVEEANKRVLELENTVKTMQLQKSLAEIGITGEDASALVGEDGSLNTEKLGEILTAREKNAVDVYKKQALESTPAPEGGKESEPKDTPDIAYAKEYVAKAKGNDTQSIIDSYK